MPKVNRYLAASLEDLHPDLQLVRELAQEAEELRAGEGKEVVGSSDQEL